MNATNDITFITDTLVEVVNDTSEGVFETLVSRDRAEYGDARDVSQWGLVTGSVVLTPGTPFGEKEAITFARESLDNVEDGTAVIVPFFTSFGFPSLVNITVEHDGDRESAMAVLRARAASERPENTTINTYASSGLVEVRPGVYQGGVWYQSVDPTSQVGWVVAARVTVEHNTADLEALRAELEEYDRLYGDDWD